MDVSSAEIEQAYNSIKDQLKEAQQRKIREIVAKSEEDAKQILIELLQGADFTALVRSRSIADSAKDGGDLGYLKFGQRGDRFSMFDQAAFSPALDQGKISNVFKGPDGYYIVKIEDVKEGKQLGLSDVWDKLKEQLLISKQQQKLNELYSRLSRDAKIEIYEKEIK
jgi:parvulin-like peptidyl-prolyl isomerase